MKSDPSRARTAIRAVLRDRMAFVSGPCTPLIPVREVDRAL
jgi:hypothetical protein